MDRDTRSLKRLIALGTTLDEWRLWQLSKGLTKLRAKAACIFMAHPGRSLTFIGVTGTEGKYPYVVSHVPLELLHRAMVALRRLPLP